MADTTTPACGTDARPARSSLHLQGRPGGAALEHAEEVAERSDAARRRFAARRGLAGEHYDGVDRGDRLFALFDASTGENSRAAALLSWLAAHRTPLGALPEQVTAAGQPASVAPLAWTDAAVLLALSAQAHPLPVTPVPPGGQPTAAGGCLLPPLSVVGR